VSLGWQLLQLPLQNIQAGKQREEVQASDFPAICAGQAQIAGKLGSPSLNGSDPSPLQNFLACTNLGQHVLFHASFSLSCIFKTVMILKNPACIFPCIYCQG